MNLVNLTPHPINIVQNDLTILTLPKCDTPARCDQITKDRLEFDYFPCPVKQISFGQVNNLPSPVAGTFYIVSQIVASAMKDKRTDLFVPCDILRDSSGNIVGCASLAIV